LCAGHGFVVDHAARNKSPPRCESSF
jgi:hypothetical protein